MFQSDLFHYWLRNVKKKINKQINKRTITIFLSFVAMEMRHRKKKRKSRQSISELKFRLSTRMIQFLCMT